MTRVLLLLASMLSFAAHAQAQWLARPNAQPFMLDRASTPRMLFLVDRSGSMSWSLSGERGVPSTQTRWALARSAILTVVAEFQGSADFSLATFHSKLTFTDRNGNGVWDPSAEPQQRDPECPRLSKTLTGDAATLEANYPESFPDPFEAGHDSNLNDTPTGDAIIELVARLEPSSDPFVLVIVTDGDPDRCENPADHGSASQQLVLRAVGTAFERGIKTLVVGVGPEVQEGHLQRVANVGVGIPAAVPGPLGAVFFRASAPRHMMTVFQDVVRSVITCEVTTEPWFAVPANLCDLKLRMNERSLQCGRDWRLKPVTVNTLELLGSACQSWRSKDAILEAELRAKTP